MRPQVELSSKTTVPSWASTCHAGPLVAGARLPELLTEAVVVLSQLLKNGPNWLYPGYAEPQSPLQFGVEVALARR